MPIAVNGRAVPIPADVLEIEVMWTDIPDPYARLGAHSIGVGAAVSNATGKRVRDLPIRRDKLL